MTAAASTTGAPRALLSAGRSALRRDPAARFAIFLVLAALLLLPLASLPTSSSRSPVQIATTAIAMAAGLIALLMIEEQMVPRPNLRLAGLAGTFLFLTLTVIAWAGWDASGGPGMAGPILRLGGHLGLVVGIGLSLGTPERLWERLRRVKSPRPMMLVALTCGFAASLLVVVLGGLALCVHLLPGSGGSTFPGVPQQLGWLLLGGCLILLGASLVRWSSLGEIERFTWAASLAAWLGLLLALAGGGTSRVGAELGWATTAVGCLAVLVVLLSRMRLGDRQRLIQELAERKLLREVALGYHGGEPLQETADRLCADLARLKNVSVTTVVSLVHPLGAVPIASYRCDPDQNFGYQLPSGNPLPQARHNYLSTRAIGGPWVDQSDMALSRAINQDEAEYLSGIAGGGLMALAYAPIRSGDEVLGVLVAGAQGQSPTAAARKLTEELPALADFALVAANRLAPLLRGPDQSQSDLAELEQIMEAGEFYSVFQPIVELRGGRVLGYEALTRFHNGMTTDRAFALARRCGQLDRLELLTFRHALRDAGSLLGPGQFLALNVSPDCLVTRYDSYAQALSRWSHPTVVEITEHAVIADYAEVQEAVKRLGGDLRLSVDDAGAGYASLRHILELRPEFVKLDISLVRGLPSDPSREAMVAGIQHFASRSGCRLIAEGIEAEEERSRLLEIGVTLGQGYLMGRPAALIELWSPGRAATQRR